jgi:hypothetical protein
MSSVDGCVSLGQSWLSVSPSLPALHDHSTSYHVDSTTAGCGRFGQTIPRSRHSPPAVLLGTRVSRSIARVLRGILPIVITLGLYSHVIATMQRDIAEEVGSRIGRTL